MSKVLARATVLSFIIQGSGAVMLLFVEILLARLLGVNQFGIYATVSAWVYLLGLVGTLGLNQLLLRFVPAYLARDDLGSLKGVIKRANLWAGLASVLIFFLGATVLLVLKIDDALFLPFVLALTSIPFLVLSSLRQAVLRGLGKFMHALLPEFILRPLIFIIFLGCYVFFSWQYLTAIKALVLSLFSTCIAFVVGAFWQHKYLPAQVKNSVAVYHDREWYAVAMSMLLIVGLNLISVRIDVVMLGMISGVSDVGVYSAASRIADVIVFGLVSANTVVVPMIASHYSSGRHVEMQSMVKLAARGILLFTAPLAFLILIFGREILGLFGSAFSVGYYALAILVVGQFASVLSGPVGSIMMMTGHQKSAAKMAGISAVINLSLNVILIPPFGMMGAATSTAISLMALNFLMLNFVRKTLLLEPTVFFNKPT